jgi:predicted transcriptional regulator of viral defense system
MQLIDYIEKLQLAGKLWFAKEDALQQLACSENVFSHALDSLKQKKHVVLLGNFVLIIPLEYRKWGIIPADWFIEPLMQYLKRPYYIGVLSASQFYGAAHQSPMQFQVITNRFMPDIKYERVYIKFLVCAKLNLLPTKKLKVRTGDANISTPETTSLDLCKYYKASGYWSNIATTMLALAESIDPHKLCELANSGAYEMAIIQRLGFILSFSAESAAIAEALYHKLNTDNFHWTPLNPSEQRVKVVKNNKWKILVNEDIEMDL